MHQLGDAEGWGWGLEQKIRCVGAANSCSKEPGRCPAGPALGSSSVGVEGDKAAQDPVLGQL